MNKTWWKEAVVYQVYVRSFNDSNGDGIGDIQGVIEKLDYLDNLGVDIIWLNPVYESPDDDNGYDISNYRKIANKFGDMNDWEELLNKVHKRGMKLIMDLVVNHTSDEHRWFEESSSDKNNPYRDYYIWKKGKEDSPPNNWKSFFGGSAWEYDNKTNEYYLHLFSKKQPDLNWENKKVREEIYEMMRWWLDKGIDGFRMDVINLISKNQEFPDGKKEGLTGSEYFANGPKVHEYIKEMNKEVLSKYDIMTVGETVMVGPKEGAKYTGENRNELDMVIHFDLMGLDEGEGGKYSTPKKIDLLELKDIILRWQKAIEEKDGWQSNYLSNHDQPRMVSRFGDDEKYRVESAKMLATFLHTLKGTPYIYQGEELGMTNTVFESIDELDDIETVNYYKEEKEKGNIISFAEVKDIINSRSRDHARTPMHWNDKENAGFTSAKPWLKINPNYKEINAKKALNNPNSVYYYYQRLIKLRKEYNSMVYGKFEILLADNEDIFAYLRKDKKENLLVILNFFDNNPIFKIPEELEIDLNKSKLLISNYEVDENKSLGKFQLKAYEARIYKIDK
ncbi:MAG: glycoside hydrolase family 13 protein [Bacillota bacterium]